MVPKRQHHSIARRFPMPKLQGMTYDLRLKRDGSLRLRLYGESFSREVGSPTRATLG